MHLPKLALFALLTPALSLCTPVQKRADLLQTQSYADFQVSDGVAGNALAEVAANFPVRDSLPSPSSSHPLWFPSIYAYMDTKVDEFRAAPAAVSESDLEILKAARKTAEAAETQEGGFNDAIDAAGGKDTPEGQRLQVGYTSPLPPALTLPSSLLDRQPPNLIGAAVPKGTSANSDQEN